MARSLFSLTGVMLLTLGAGLAVADDVNYYDKDGITYRETRQVTQRTVPQTTMQSQDYPYLRERYTTELQEVQRSYQVPITEYQWKAETHRSWNPFTPPYVAYRLVPQTRYETKTETVKIPVAKREVVQDKITRQVPVTTHRVAQEEVVTRVAVGHSGAAGATNVATSTGPRSGGVSTTQVSTGGSNDQLGGLSKLDTDPPKQPVNWQPSDGTARR